MLRIPRSILHPLALDQDFIGRDRVMTWRRFEQSQLRAQVGYLVIVTNFSGTSGQR
jgi:hypothetical protein